MYSNNISRVEVIMDLEEVVVVRRANVNSG